MSRYSAEEGDDSGYFANQRIDEIRRANGRIDYLLGVVRVIELNVDGLNTKGFQQKKETQAALDRIKVLCRDTLK